MADGPRRKVAAPLLRRILLINLVAPIVLAIGLLGLDKYRQGLIEARLSALAGQAELIAGALGEAAIAGGLDPQGLDVDGAAQILSRVLAGRPERARLFDDAGTLVVDSRRLAASGRQVDSESLPPPGLPGLGQTVDRLFRAVESALGRAPEVYVERPGESAADYPEALAALEGDGATRARVRRDGLAVLSAAEPVQRLRKVLGALLLSVEAVEIEAAVAAERLSIFLAFALTLAATIGASVLLAAWIARPIRALAEAADEVRSGLGRRAVLPDLSARGDEIGELSRALGRMTRALYDRLDAIEAFAADVAHELRGPLAGLRASVEALSLTRDPASLRRLGEAAVAEVTRIDHLISDIADASRLDAEMSRESFAAVDLAALARAVAEAADREPARIVVDAPAAVPVAGVEVALSRAVANLIDNALSFSPAGGAVRVEVARESAGASLTVEDQGPGIPEERREKVFERFYTDRPEGRPGETHSGLGLAIARRIVEAHGGTLTAEARPDGATGARLVLRLPAPPSMLTGAGGGLV